MEKYIWASLRIAMGWIFLWVFLDKLFGLGFSTSANKAWILGGSPTYGFLKMATIGPFTSLYQSIAGNPFVDGLFMAGLLLIGLSLLLGVGVRIAGFSGAFMLILMYTAGFMPPQNNPFLDEHLIYAIVMIGLIVSRSGNCIGLGKWWTNTKLVKSYPLLE